MTQSRRSFITSAAASLAALPVISMAQEQSGKSVQQVPDYIEHAHKKFYPNGKVAPYIGNTVICHVPVQCRFREDMVAIREELAHCSFRNKFALLPPSSYHMTVFPGANNPEKELSSWPKDLPLSASIEECTELVRGRFMKEKLSVKAPFRIRLDAEETLDAKHPIATLRMVGADAEAESALRKTRDQLSRIYNHRDPDHDRYGFHITLGYTLEVLTPEEDLEYRDILKRQMERIMKRTPVLELGLPEFCTFPDMSIFYTEALMRVG